MRGANSAIALVSRSRSCSCCNGAVGALSRIDESIGTTAGFVSGDGSLVATAASSTHETAGAWHALAAESEQQKSTERSERSRTEG